jgi:hypothetical protein
LVKIKNFLPESRQIFLVFGVALFIVHSWSIHTFLYNIPSFILYMNIGQIVGVFAYMMAFALLESLLVMGLLLFVSAILPRAWYRDKFVSKGFLTILVSAALAIAIRLSLGNLYPGIEELYGKVLIAGLVLIGSILAVHYYQPLQKVLEFLAEQISIMTYLYLPIGIISVVVVLARNIF